MMATVAPSLSHQPPRVGAGVHFPGDLTHWVSGASLLRIVRQSAPQAGGSWLNLVDQRSERDESDDLLVLVCYCYLRAIYHSMDVVRQLDEDPNLQDLRERLVLRPEQIRRFRRDRRRALSDSLTRSLVALWQERSGVSSSASVAPASGNARSADFAFLEPFYLTAQDRVDRAVILDSMALDY